MQRPRVWRRFFEEVGGQVFHGVQPQGYPRRCRPTEVQPEEIATSGVGARGDGLHVQVIFEHTLKTCVLSGIGDITWFTLHNVFEYVVALQRFQGILQGQLVVRVCTVHLAVPQLEGETKCPIRCRRHRGNNSSTSCFRDDPPLGRHGSKARRVWE